jgi:hypothetical protein
VIWLIGARKPRPVGNGCELGMVPVAAGPVTGRWRFFEGTVGGLGRMEESVPHPPFANPPWGVVTHLHHDAQTKRGDVPGVAGDLEPRPALGLS